MKSLKIGLLPLALIAGWVATGHAQPPGKQPPGGRGGQGNRPESPPRFELGRVLPPPVREQLQLTPEQERQIADLERDVKEKLSKILTAEQIKQAESARPRGPGGPPGAGDGNRNGRGRREGGGPPGKTPPDKDGPADEPATAPGIQWFATWESGLIEAKRTGRPILLVSAAPHCAGVPGIW